MSDHQQLTDLKRLVADIKANEDFLPDEAEIFELCVGVEDLVAEIERLRKIEEAAAHYAGFVLPYYSRPMVAARGRLRAALVGKEKP